jgi:hypothetical protein
MRYYLFVVIMMVASVASAQDVYVSPDENLADAFRTAREMKRLQTNIDSVTIHLKKGIYRLDEPLFIRPEDSHTTVIGEDSTVISGGVRLSHWRKEGNLWVTDVPDFNGRPFDFRQLWVNGRKADCARDVTDFDHMYRIRNVDKQHQLIWVPASAVRRLVDKQGKLVAPYVEMVLHEMWSVANLRIKFIVIEGDSAAISFHQPESRLQFAHPWPSPMVTTDGHNSAFYLRNALPLLDTPGEWYHDIRTQRLYYLPRADENMQHADIEVPALETLVSVDGIEGRTVNNVTFSNITFRHTTWMRPSLQGHVPLQAGMYLIDAYKLRPQIDRKDGNHKLDNQGWLGRAAAAVQLNWTQNVSFEHCIFTQLGGSGLDYAEGCHHGEVTDCHFHDIAMNGVVIGSFSPKGLETHILYNPTDTNEVCNNQQITHCLIEDVGNEDWGCLGIAAGYVANIYIGHNEIREVPYTGISLGWGWNCLPGCMHSNRMEYNLIHHYAQHTYDCAGIYTLGNQQSTLIQNNVIRDIYHPVYAHDPNHWFYLYTDEGSSGITIRNNWTPSEKFLQNANGPGNVWLNNGPQVKIEKAGK